jgi:hypothetical protein
MRFGSHLYGTATPASDLDIKAVHLPTRNEILLQRTKPVIQHKTKEDRNAKNTADDVDFESYSLQKYLQLVLEGQTVALDMLFAPIDAFTKPANAVWLFIKANRQRLLTKKYASFVGYCRQQANKYGIKGSRMAAARLTVECLAPVMDMLGTQAKLEQMHDVLQELTKHSEHISIEDIPQVSGATVKHLVVCNRKAPYTSSIKNAHTIYLSLLNEYGKRAAAAERNEGVDWKSLSHAVRIGRQAVELLTTHAVTFPRPDAAHLLAIKMGEKDYSEVAEEIEQLLAGIEDASAKSSLPDEPDQAFVDDLVMGLYACIVEERPMLCALSTSTQAIYTRECAAETHTDRR